MGAHRGHTTRRRITRKRGNKHSSGSDGNGGGDGTDNGGSSLESGSFGDTAASEEQDGVQSGAVHEDSSSVVDQGGLAPDAFLARVACLSSDGMTTVDEQSRFPIMSGYTYHPDFLWAGARGYAGNLDPPHKVCTTRQHYLYNNRQYEDSIKGMGSEECNNQYVQLHRLCREILQCWFRG